MTKAMNNLIDNAGELDKAITAWGAKGKKWANEGHHLAMSAITLMSKANDIGPMNRLLLAMPKGTKVKSMKEWMLAFAPLIENEGESAADKPLIYTKDKAFNLVDAAKNPWFNFSPEAATDPVVDLLKLTMAVIKKAKSGKEGVQLVHAEMLSKLEALAEEFTTAEEVSEETDPE